MYLMTEEDSIGPQSIFWYIKCIKHLKALMIKENKIDKFENLVSKYDASGYNFHHRIAILADFCDHENQFNGKVIKFLLDMECKLDVSNWDFLTIMPYLLRKGSR